MLGFFRRDVFCYTMDMDELLNTLISLEKGFWSAAGTDGRYYKDNFSNIGMMVLPLEDGIMNKSKAIEAVKHSEKWDNFSIDNPQLLSISESEVALIYSTIGERGNEPVYKAPISSSYRSERDGWKLVLHQQTSI